MREEGDEVAVIIPTWYNRLDWIGSALSSDLGGRPKSLKVKQEFAKAEKARLGTRICVNN